MKKLIVLSAVLFAASTGSVSAQSLLDLLNGRSSQKTEQAEKPAVDKINIDALKGEWKYSGAAVEFTGTDLVAMLGSSMAAPAIKQSLESYYSKAGVVQGSCTLEFKDGDVYTARTAAQNIGGLYVFDARNQTVAVTYDHPGLGGQNTLNGRLTFTGERLKLTFEADKIAAIIKELTKGQTLDQNVQDMLDMIAEYKGLYLGFEMEK